MLVNFSQVLTLSTTIIDSQLTSKMTSRNCRTSQPIPVSSNQSGNYRHYSQQPKIGRVLNGRSKNVNLSGLTGVQKKYLKISSPPFFPLITSFFPLSLETIHLRPQHCGTARTLIIINL